MADITDKENVSPLRSPYKAKSARMSISPVKAAKKGRSKSIGPGGLEGAMDEPRRTSPSKDRRKSSFAPAVKSILPSKEDEAKRRAARRKSLANRRVSFAPEATLHTWDVIEYMREATTSSASSENTRRASEANGSPNQDYGSDATDPPSTPPEQADEPAPILASPAHQRDLHQKKRRRSSAVPPLNFNNPDDVYSSSPPSGSSPMTGSDQADDESSDDEEEDGDDEGTAMSLDAPESTGEITTRSHASGASSDSSARLDAALKLAAQQAGTRGIDYDENGDMSMELATQEITNAFQPWVQQASALTPMARNLMAVQDQENINPFSPAFRAHVGSERPAMIEEEDEEDDMSMDMTCAVGGIVQADKIPVEEEIEDETMDFTQAVGKIHEQSQSRSTNMWRQIKRDLTTNTFERELKRRISATMAGSPITNESHELQSPQKESLQRESKRRRSSAASSSLGDASMDLTAAIGGLEQQDITDGPMDMTAVLGVIRKTASPVKQSRRTSLRKRRSSAQSAMVDSQLAEGPAEPSESKIAPGSKKARFSDVSQDNDEDISMELTTAFGSVAHKDPQASEELSRPTTPKHIPASPETGSPTTPKDQDRFRQASDMSAKKLLTPIFEQHSEDFGEAMDVDIPSSLQAGRDRTPERNTPTRRSPARSLKASPSPSHAVKYPQLTSDDRAMTPEASPDRSKQSSMMGTPTTPVGKDVFEQSLPSPMLEKQMRSSPMRHAPSPVTACHAATQKALTDSIRMLSTPRKEAGISPLKRLKDLTPKQTPMRRLISPVKMATPRTKTPRLAAPLHDLDPVSQQLSEELSKSIQKPALIKKTRLDDFLDMAGIKFMDLTATKRRYTVAPTPAKQRNMQEQINEDGEDGEADQSLEAIAVAAACTVPELDLYQHSCRELKQYIAEGRTFSKNVEAEVYEQPPPLIRAYVSASPKRKAELDSYMRDAKTQARLESKEIWYGWRSQLLEGLDDGLRSIQTGFEDDAALLASREAALEAVLSSALQQHEALQEQAAALEKTRSAEVMSEDERVELNDARKQLAELNNELAKKRQTIAELDQDLSEQARFQDVYDEAISEAYGAIAEADRVSEACRGWSTDEVAKLKASTDRIKQTYGWSITSATSHGVELDYKGQLQLFFDPLAFNIQQSNDTPSENRPISLVYIADAAEHKSQQLTTDKRFFLQLIRAHLQCLVQSQTSVKDLLDLVSSGWETTCRIHQTLRRLEMENMVQISILSDERLGVEVALLLPKVQTKVRIFFEICASVGQEGEDSSTGPRVQTSLEVRGKVMYGEQYKEQKMGDFVLSRIGKSLDGWEIAVRDLKARLVATGRKGT